ncbi:hypothetical protein [Aquimarina litoralis]|uniref:hypothetical protein n=1 Tax=Aquimarina litoralis TaxID=584605 RepID=UPI001C5A27F3|nr:hypothetical protein [Aquimarina litoralis]MBW1295033.1 hypothetical protein [Aquimarina litoralis]
MYSQNINPTEEIKQLIASGKNHIIVLALDQLKKKENISFQEKDFHFVLVKASDKRILVQFGYNVMYLPKNTSYYSDIIVELPSGSISKSSKSNDETNTTYYYPNKADLQTIHSIMNPDGIKKDIFNIGIPNPPTIIKETENSYLVYFSSREPYLGGVFSEEEIDKKTGEIISFINGHYEPIPILPDDTVHQEKFIEITN